MTTVNLLSSTIEHRFAPGITLKNRISYGDYDKFYQNVFPGAVNAAATTVAISAYNNATTRQNLFNQTDLIVSRRTGGIGHTVLFGTEFGRQETENFRNTGFFTEPRPERDVGERAGLRRRRSICRSSCGRTRPMPTTRACRRWRRCTRRIRLR